MTKERKYIIAVIVLDALALIGLFVLKPLAKLMIDVFPDCFFVRNFGFECPSCGGTRCVFQFFGGNFYESFSLNPLFFLAIIYIIILFVFLNLSLFKLNFFRRAVKIMASWQAAIGFAVCYLVFGIIRMITCFA